MKALWLCLCLGLAACADTGTKTWYRADGSTNAPGQIEADKVACEQEMRKPQATRAAGLDRDVIQADAYEKCMTRLGYTDSKIGARAAGCGKRATAGCATSWRRAHSQALLQAPRPLPPRHLQPTAER